MVLSQQATFKLSPTALEATRALMAELAIGGATDHLGTITEEHLSTRGKELRLALALEACAALGIDQESAIVWAAACELLHNATLIHDDLQDADRERRGAPAVWVKHGAAQAINAGDLLLMLPFRALERLPETGQQCWYLSRILAQRAEETARGQSAELELLNHNRLSWPDYLAAAEGKTSSLFVVPVQGALILAGHTPDAARAMADELKAAGLLFQMQDDLRDVFGCKKGREPGGDLREGRVSALVVEYLQRVPEDRQWLLRLLRASPEQTTATEIAEAAERFQRSGAHLAVYKRMEGLKKQLAESETMKRLPRLQLIVEGFVAHVMASLTPHPLRST